MTNQVETNFDGFVIEGDRNTYHLRLVRRLAAGGVFVELWQPYYAEEALGMATAKSHAEQWLDEDRQNGITRGPRLEDLM